MTNLGCYNTLRVIRSAEHGLYLDGLQVGDILFPNRYVPAGTRIGDEVSVFLYLDSDDRPIATTETPRVQVGEYAALQVMSADGRYGAFLDWGLKKDLFLPRSEQTRSVEPGDWIVVRACVDPRSNRIIATMRLESYLNQTEPSYRKGEAVKLIVVDRTDLGYKAIVENAHWGLLYHTELRIDLYYGQKLDGFVKELREDGKIDLSLDQAGYSRVAPLAERIHAELKAQGGKLPYDDSSSPEDIRRVFGCSKKAYKQAIGSLFKERRIVMLERGIALPFDPPDPLPSRSNTRR